MPFHCNCPQVTKLLSQMLGEKATPSVLATAFSEMDADGKTVPSPYVSTVFVAKTLPFLVAALRLGRDRLWGVRELLRHRRLGVLDVKCLSGGCCPGVQFGVTGCASRLENALTVWHAVIINPPPPTNRPSHQGCQRCSCGASWTIVQHDGPNHLGLCALPLAPVVHSGSSQPFFAARAG